MGTVIRNIRPLAGDSESLTVRVDGSEISTVSTGTLPSQPADAVIDANGSPVLGGWVNAHTHLAMVLFRGLADGVPLDVWLKDHVWPIEQQLEPQDVYWCTLLALAEAIRGGTTCVADMYFHCDEVVRAIEESGVRGVVSYGMIATSLDARGRSELKTAEQLIRRWDGTAGGRIRVAVSPHAVYTCGKDVWREAIALARDQGVLLHTHLSETRQEVADWREKTGLSPVQYLEELGAFENPAIAAHCVHVNANEIDILARNGVAVAHCPKSNAKLGSGIAPVRALRRAGVLVVLGTDGAASNNRLDMVEELRMACLLQRASDEDPNGLSAHEAVLMASDAGRCALGLPAAGLVPGDAADLVLFDVERPHLTPPHDPEPMLTFALGASDVSDVIVDGRVLMRSGELLTIDEKRVQSEVSRLFRRLRPT